MEGDYVTMILQKVLISGRRVVGFLGGNPQKEREWSGGVERTLSVTGGDRKDTKQ